MSESQVVALNRLSHALGLLAGVILARSSYGQELVWYYDDVKRDESLAFAAVGPDLTSDQVPELLIAAVKGGCVSTAEGRVELRSTVQGELRRWCGSVDGSLFGGPCRWLSDVDAGGTRDFVVGERGFIDPFWGNDTGRLTCFSSENGHAIWEVVGTQNGGRFGAFEVLGDCDSDGKADLLVGAEFYGGNGEGQAWVLSGVDGSTIRTHIGPSPDSRLGAGVLGLGDVDGDGVHDYSVWWRNQINKGRVDVRSGRTGALVLRIEGTRGDNTGRTMARADDLDGDGLADLLITGTSGNGHVDAYSPATGALLWRIDGTTLTENFGERVLQLSDLTGDGHQELLISAIYDDHDAKDAGRVDLICGRTHRALYRFYPELEGVTMFGALLDRGADFNLDGVEDLIMGSYIGGKYVSKGGFFAIRAGNDLWLQADPTSPVDGDTVVVDLRGAAAGQLGLIALTAIDGVPLFETLLLAPFDSNGELQLCADIDASLSGMQFTVMGYAQNKKGRGPLIDASPFSVSVQ